MLYSIYTADQWLSYDSQKLIAVATTKIKALALIKKYIIINELPKLTADDLHMLDKHSQTQNGNSTQFIMEEVQKNELF